MDVRFGTKDWDRECLGSTRVLFARVGAFPTRFHRPLPRHTHTHIHTHRHLNSFSGVCYWIYRFSLIRRNRLHRSKRQFEIQVFANIFLSRSTISGNTLYRLMFTLSSSCVSQTIISVLTAFIFTAAAVYINQCRSNGIDWWNLILLFWAFERKNHDVAHLA